MMFAIAFDLTVAKVKKHHPQGVSRAYVEIGRELRTKGFDRKQGSVYLTNRNDLANLFAAIRALESLSWFPFCVRDIRGFRVEEWSDFTAMVTERARAHSAGADVTLQKKRGRATGFQEDATVYAAGPSELIGQVRRFGDEGPAYEVMELLPNDEVLVEVIYSEERLALPVAEVLADPMAETIP
jgi:virulence-associated protein VapD